MYLVLMKQVQAFRQILSSSSAAASSCSSSLICSSAAPSPSGEHKSSKGECSRSHQTTRTYHLIFIHLLGKKDLEIKRRVVTGSWPYLWLSCTPAAADMSGPGQTSAMGWRAASCTAAAGTTSWISCVLSPDRQRPSQIVNSVTHIP